MFTVLLGVDDAEQLENVRVELQFFAKAEDADTHIGVFAFHNSLILVNHGLNAHAFVQALYELLLFRIVHLIHTEHLITVFQKPV